MARFGRGAERPEPGIDWSDTASVRWEWPIADADPEIDLDRWRAGMDRYDRSSENDYRSLMSAAAEICAVLRHELYGPSLLVVSDAARSTWNVLVSATCPPPDRQTLSPDARRFVRLALTVAKKYGWQPVGLGGDGFVGRVFEDPGMVMLFRAAIAPSESAVTGDLNAFFRDNPPALPEPEVPPDPDADATRHVKDVLARADAGDSAAQARAAAFAAQMRGDLDDALLLHQRAAGLGDVDAMFDAGCIAEECGRRALSDHWYGMAADAGHAVAMHNLGAQAVRDGDLAAAAEWFERAGAAGDIDAYAALTQLADEAGQDADELRWSGLGAAGGQPFCMMRYGQLLVRNNPYKPDVLRRAVVFLERAGDAGETPALYLAGITHVQLGDRAQARHWLLRAESAGHPRAGRVLDDIGR